MTRDETKTILATIAAVYPPNLMPQVTDLTINVWFQMIQDLPYKSASAAIAAWMASNKYPPTIADIRELITRPLAGNRITAEECWGKIQKSTLYHGWTQPEKAQEFLGPDIWQIVERFGWEYFCRMPIDDESTYFAQFRNAWNTESRRVAESAQLPDKVKAVLAGIASKPLQLGGQ